MLQYTSFGHPLFGAQPCKELPRSPMLLDIVLVSLDLYLVAFVIVIARAFIVALEVSWHSISPSYHVQEVIASLPCLPTSTVAVPAGTLPFVTSPQS